MFGCVLLLAVPLRTEAHALGADCKVNGARVELEAYYDDDTPARDARVRVADGEGQQVAEGRTDAAGRWSFDRPRAGTYRVIVDAGAGHRKELTITLAAENTSPSPSGHTTTQAVVTGDGPTRAAFTAFPWLQLGIGVAILGALGGGFWLARRNPSPPSI
jgi:nickel transport protein